MDASPLDKLPAELRLEIYALVLAQPCAINLVRSQDENTLVLEQGCSTCDRLLAITETCRLVRKESLPVFYHYNDFWFPTLPRATSFESPSALCPDNPLHAANLTLFRHWLRGIGGKSAASIRYLKFDFGSVYNTPRQERWWLDAQMVADQIVNEGLSKKCCVAARVDLRFTLRPDLHCTQDGDFSVVRNNITVELPTKNMRDAVAIMEEAVSSRIKKYKAHKHHDWDDCGFGPSVINDLERGRAFAVKTMMEQCEIEREA